jgi:hypothetical protein
MKRVSTYQLKGTGLESPNVIALPPGAKALSAGIDHQGELCLFVSVPAAPSEVQETRRFLAIHHGAALPDDAIFIGTALNGRAVQHVFELV